MARPHRRALAFLGFWVQQAPCGTPRIARGGQSACITESRRSKRWIASIGAPRYGYTFDADRRLVPVPEQQKHIRRICGLASAGHSPRVISRRLREDEVKLSHVTVRKIVRRSSATNDRYSDPMRK
jgi:hypothetical protein